MWAQVLEGHLKDAKMNWDQWERGATTLKVSRGVDLALWTRAERGVIPARRRAAARSKAEPPPPLWQRPADSYGTRFDPVGLEQERAEA